MHFKLLLRLKNCGNIRIWINVLLRYLMQTTLHLVVNIARYRCMLVVTLPQTGSDLSHWLLEVALLFEITNNLEYPVVLKSIEQSRDGPQT